MERLHKTGVWGVAPEKTIFPFYDSGRGAICDARNCDVWIWNVDNDYCAMSEHFHNPPDEEYLFTPMNTRVSPAGVPVPSSLCNSP